MSSIEVLLLASQGLSLHLTVFLTPRGGWLGVNTKIVDHLLEPRL
ncbi:MAG: hypothetical protein WAT23_08820 [Chromatiaceae bacterium]